MSIRRRKRFEVAATTVTRAQGASPRYLHLNLRAEITLTSPYRNGPTNAGVFTDTSVLPPPCAGPEGGIRFASPDVSPRRSACAGHVELTLKCAVVNIPSAWPKAGDLRSPKCLADSWSVSPRAAIPSERGDWLGRSETVPAPYVVQMHNHGVGHG